MNTCQYCGVETERFIECESCRISNRRKLINELVQLWQEIVNSEPDAEIKKKASTKVLGYRKMLSGTQ